MHSSVLVRDDSPARRLQDYLVPHEYVENMRRSMLNRCPVSTYKQVCDLFLAELGRLPHEVTLIPSLLQPWQAGRPVFCREYFSYLPV